MKRVGLDEVRTEPNPLGVHEIRKPLSKVLDTSAFAMNYYELAPGESFSGGLHTHHDQEEVFYVLEGTATFDVSGGPGDPVERVAVGPDEAIRFAPGEFQVGRNEGEERVAAFALGAPDARHDFDAVEAATFCPECGAETGHSVALEDGSFEFTCESCGLERAP
jgi:mannose-6-phosphate isomerase-like protein (cupin superfamily)